MDIKIGVREMAEFVSSSGDLTSEFFSNKDLEDGKKAHDYLQDKYNEASVSELFIKQILTYKDDCITVSGFIDGVLNIDDKIILEEIKSTHAELDEIDIEYHKEHFAQLKHYGYLYGIQNGLENLNLRLTYISLIDYQTKSFDMVLSIQELESFFFESIAEYVDWLKTLDQASTDKLITIKEMKFPFTTMRPGQRDLMKATYNTMKNSDTLYAVAPTGIGKTIATVFSALKTMEEKNEKLFYLTAKGMGRTVACDSIKVLYSKGLKMKTLVLYAKSKCCLLDIKNCDAKACPYAKGFFFRLKDAVKEIFNETDFYDFDTIQKYAKKHQICSFEFALYLSYFCDFIIADYNYVFDPRAHLIRYFDDDSYKPKILVDEAHNLISRSKDMYSATLNVLSLKLLRKLLTGIKPSLRKEINLGIEIMESYSEKLEPNLVYYDSSINLDLVNILKKINQKAETILSDNPEIKHRDEIRDIFFTIQDFVSISNYFSPSHRFLVKEMNENIEITLLCLDASSFILDTIQNSCHGTVFFSATLYPIKYHMDLLTKGLGNYLVLSSSFDKDNLDLIVRDSISTKYKNRLESIDDIIDTIDILVESKPGNYIVFFPSYAYMDLVIKNLGETSYEYFSQKSNMTELERQEYFDKFSDTNTTKVGFFVMGGVFSEGLDYVGDLLNGVIIVGVGLPQVCIENDLLKEYFEENDMQGFDYAYTYPGFNKVVQAAGRVIRTETDRGVVILLDERYRYLVYQNMMPEFWSNRKTINRSYDLKKELTYFWNKKKA